MAYHKFWQIEKEEAHQEYLDSIEQYRLANGYAVPGEFVVGLGLKD